MLQWISWGIQLIVFGIIVIVVGGFTIAAIRDLHEFLSEDSRLVRRIQKQARVNEELAEAYKQLRESEKKLDERSD